MHTWPCHEPLGETLQASIGLVTARRVLRRLRLAAPSAESVSLLQLEEEEVKLTRWPRVPTQSFKRRTFGRASYPGPRPVTGVNVGLPEGAGVELEVSIRGMEDRAGFTS